MIKKLGQEMLKCFLLILSTGAHSPSMISQGRIGALVTAKPTDQKSNFRGSCRNIWFAC